jgi:hypothetical protein
LIDLRMRLCQALSPSLILSLFLPWISFIIFASNSYCFSAHPFLAGLLSEARA